MRSRTGRAETQRFASACVLGADGQGDLQYTVLIDNLNSVYNTGGCQVIAFADGGAGIYQMPQPAGNFLCPQGGVSG